MSHLNAWKKLVWQKRPRCDRAVAMKRKRLSRLSNADKRGLIYVKTSVPVEFASFPASIKLDLTLKLMAQSNAVLDDLSLLK